MFLPDTVIYCDCFKHHTWGRATVRPGGNDNQWLFLGCHLSQRLGGAATTHTSILLPAKMLMTRNEASEWGGEGKVSISQKVCSHFPEAQCHQQKSLKAGFSFGCTLETRPWPAVWGKISNSLSLASGKTWPFFGELFSPLCPDRIKVWTALLLLWSSRSNEQVPSVLLLLQQSPQNF